MNDMTFRFQGAAAADEPLWRGSPGQVSASSSPRVSGRGQKSSRSVAADWQDRLASHLRRLHPVKTADCVAARCRGQISAAQVRKWLNRGSAPGGAALLWLATCYGPSLLVACFGPCPATCGGRPDWLDVAMSAEQEEQLGLRLQQLRAELDETIRSRT